MLLIPCFANIDSRIISMQVDKALLVRNVLSETARMSLSLTRQHTDSINAKIRDLRHLLLWPLLS